MTKLKLIAELCGFLAADGSVFIRKEKTGKSHYEFRFYPDHESVLKRFLYVFEQLYGVTPHAKNMGNYFYVQIQNKKACIDLLKLAKFGSLSWSIPKIIKNDKKIVRFWLRAYFDCDGYVSKKYIQLQSVNEKGLKEISKLLTNWNIGTKIYRYERPNKNWNVNYLLNINKKQDRLKFLKTIGFNHKVKLNKLKSFYVLESPNQVGHQN